MNKDIPQKIFKNLQSLILRVNYIESMAAFLLITGMFFWFITRIVLNIMGE